MNVKSYPVPTAAAPDDADIMQWLDDGIALATDDCDVEPDGICEHGHPSWLIRYGMI